MVTFAYGNWEFGLSLEQVIQQAIIVQSRLSDYEHLAPGNTTVQNATLAQIINRKIAKWLKAMPGIGWATETITLVNGQNEYPIPATMLGRQIVQLRFSNDAVNQGYTNRPIQFFGQFGKANLPAWVLSGQQQFGFPVGFTLSDDATLIQVWPWPSGGYIVNVTFQQDYTPITGANVANPTPTPPADPIVIGELPSTWIQAFAADVGAEVLQSLDAAGAAVLQQYADGELALVSERLTQLQAADYPLQKGSGSMAGNPLYATQFNNWVP